MENKMTHILLSEVGVHFTEMKTVRWDGISSPWSVMLTLKPQKMTQASLSHFPKQVVDKMILIAFKSLQPYWYSMDFFLSLTSEVGDRVFRNGIFWPCDFCGDAMCRGADCPPFAFNFTPSNTNASSNGKILFTHTYPHTYITFITHWIWILPLY